MAKIKVTDAKRYLKELTIQQKDEELLYLIKNFKEVEDYFSFKINSENKTIIYEEYLNKISKEFPFNFSKKEPSFKNIKVLISDFFKITNNLELKLFLILHAFEVGTEYGKFWGVDYSSFYKSLTTLFYEAAKGIVEFKMEGAVIKKIYSVYEKIEDFAWGYADEIDRIFIDIVVDYVDNFLDPDDYLAVFHKIDN